VEAEAAGASACARPGPAAVLSSSSPKSNSLEGEVVALGIFRMSSKQRKFETQLCSMNVVCT
jgi:hypothetical protein